MGAMASLPFPAQVAEIHKASKHGQLYDMGGGTKSCSAQVEPPEPHEYDIPPASHMYSVSSVPLSTPNLGLGKVLLFLCPQVGHSFLTSPGTPALPLRCQTRPWSFSALPAMPFPALVSCMILTPK